MTSLCTDVPPPSGKIGRGDYPLPLFPEGGGKSVHRLRNDIFSFLAFVIYVLAVVRYRDDLCTHSKTFYGIREDSKYVSCFKGLK